MLLFNSSQTNWLESKIKRKWHIRFKEAIRSRCKWHNNSIGNLKENFRKGFHSLLPIENVKNYETF